MINSKQELQEYLYRDSLANRRKTVKTKLFGDEIWKFIVAMRKLDFYDSMRKKSKLYLPLFIFYKFRYHSLSVKLGFSIPYNVFGKGLSIAHYGALCVNSAAVVGENCRIHESVTIGATGGSDKAPRIGNNVLIGSGTRIIGDITIADNVAIGAGSVVVKSIEEQGTTWAGVPARKISDNDSKPHLSPMLFG